MGQVKRVSVAIVMRDTGKGMKAKDIQAIEKLAQSSVGFDARRGDVITVTSRPFTDNAAPEQPWYKVDMADHRWIPGVSQIAAAPAILALVFFAVLRPFPNQALAAPGPALPQPPGQPTPPPHADQQAPE